MLASRIALTLALLPAFTLASGCDEKEGPAPKDVDGVDTQPKQIDADGDESGGSSGSSTSAEESEEESATTDHGEEHPDEPPPANPPPAEPRPDEAVMCDAEETLRACKTAEGLPGESVCVLGEGGEAVWTECATELPCWPGNNYDYGCMGEICGFDGETLVHYAWAEDDCNTPLVLNFDGEPLRFDAATAASFDISGVGECLSTDWPTLPWLALDRDGDGSIEDGRELFGSGSVLASGVRASHGFEALAELDANRDGVIDAADPVFAELVLWADGDGDRRGELREMTPVGAVGLVAIHLDVAVRAECDARGNCGRERARFEFRAETGQIRSGEVVDVYLACQ